MAEPLISAIAEKVLSKLGSLAYQELSLLCGVKNDIQKLANTLNTIKIVLSDAEEQQVHKQGLKLWLENLKYVCYDIEDVLDEFKVEAQRKQVIANHGSIRTKVRRFFSCSNPLAFSFMIGHKIKEVKKRLDEIADEKEKFNLTKKIENKLVMVRERETYSFVHASDVIGRDKEKDEIIKGLTNHSDSEYVSVVSIVGIGGLGKTALAKLVYNDEMIKNHFELKMWICVTEDFDLKKLITKILEFVTDKTYNEDLNKLITILEENLSGRKYLLVLDDVWNEVREKWIELRALLMLGAYGSKIIVTTRSHQVASIMDSVSTYNLGGLSLHECLKLFVKSPFKAGQENQYPNLMKIGEEIVKKCGGIPLAVRTLGSLLYSSTDEQDWKKVRDNEIWELEQNENHILHVLKLSYDHLSPHLKQCFVYCSAFPKDYPFDSLFIVQFWMAHGLIKSSNNANQDLEKIGNKYLNELMSRSFFQDFEDQFGCYDFKMHDLMHDLATSLMKSECLIAKSSSHVCPKTVRHISFFDTPEIDSISFLSDLCKVRTIIFPVENEGPSKSLLKSLISNCQFLRMLDLDYSNIEVLPKEIGDLKHLRYLSLSSNHKIKNLPNSICKLQSLQTLKFLECEELKELPRKIRCLMSLRTLWLTTNENYLPKNGIGYLNSLRELEIDDCHNLKYLFEDIGGLRFLRRLVIVNCPNLISLPHGMKYISSLEELGLNNCEKLNLNLGVGLESNNHYQDLKIERLQLQRLLLCGLPQLVELPQWLLQACANALQRLQIAYCLNLKALPESMQNLESVQVLEILGCPELSSLPKDMSRLTALRKLIIVDCPALSETCKPGIGEDWSKIAHVPEIWLDGEKITPNNL